MLNHDSHLQKLNPVESTNGTGPLPALLTGVLHTFIAFDWGEEVDLARADLLLSPESRYLPRRCQNPSLIAYHPTPLRYDLQPVLIDLPVLGRREVQSRATVFDFGAASVALHTPFTLTPVELTRIAASLSHPQIMEVAAATVLRPLYEDLRSAITRPSWGERTEEYFVFEFSPEEVPVDAVLTTSAEWLAGLVRLEASTLFKDEVSEALRHQIRYTNNDLFAADWAAAVVVDTDCDDTLEMVEFANLQLLEFREIDDRLDSRMMSTYRMVHSLARRWLPFWRPHTGHLRALGDLKIEANTMFDRTQNVLKLAGDQYLARLYRLLAARFHLDAWQQSIQRSLDVTEAAYQVLADQAASWRAELLELMLVLLILVEILLTLAGF